MPDRNKVIRLSSINRLPVNGESYILLDSQQDSINYIHSLALVPVLKRINPDGGCEINFTGDEVQLLNYAECGKFPICFEMQPQFSYLVIGIIPQGVIPDFAPRGGESSSPNAPVRQPSAEDNQRDRQMVHELVATQSARLRAIGILINA